MAPSLRRLQGREGEGKKNSSQSMELGNILRMNDGDGLYSYAANSNFQKDVIKMAMPAVEEAVKKLYNGGYGKSLKVADLGCATGVNTFTATRHIANTIYNQCETAKTKPPEIQFFLNDLPGNDFNSVFRSIPELEQSFREDKGQPFGSRFVNGVPGSFYSRLFPVDSLDFVHSSSSLHWISKVPDGIENNGINIYIGRTSPPEVAKAYAAQFRRDFRRFLELRAEEMSSGARMVVTLLGRNPAYEDGRDFMWAWDTLSDSIQSVVREGVIQAKDVDSFNMPFYAPSEAEVRKIIEDEGSFDIVKIELVRSFWYLQNPDSGDVLECANRWAGLIRAVSEPVMAVHFAGHVIDRVFLNFAQQMVTLLSARKLSFASVVISLKKKA